MADKDLLKIFRILENILRKHRRGLVLHKSVIGTRVGSGKKALHLYGKREVGILRRKPQQTYIAGIIMQKHFAGLYFMPIYSHPRSFKLKNPDLLKSLRGKSCFNIVKLAPEMLREIDGMIRQGIAIYKKEGWV